MRNRKIKAGSFQDVAESKFRKGDKIDLSKLWGKDEEELDPKKVEEICDTK